MLWRSVELKGSRMQSSATDTNLTKPKGLNKSENP